VPSLLSNRIPSLCELEGHLIPGRKLSHHIRRADSSLVSQPPVCSCRLQHDMERLKLVGEGMGSGARTGLGADWPWLLAAVTRKRYSVPGSSSSTVASSSGPANASEK